MLKTHKKKINSLRSDSIFFLCNANFHPPRDSDAPADVIRIKHILTAQSSESCVADGRLRKALKKLLEKSIKENIKHKNILK